MLNIFCRFRRLADSNLCVSCDNIDLADLLIVTILSTSLGNSETRLEVGDGDSFLLDNMLEELIIRAKFLPATVLYIVSSFTSGGLTTPKSDFRKFLRCSCFFTSIVSWRLSSFFSSLIWFRTPLANILQIYMHASNFHGACFILMCNKDY